MPDLCPAKQRQNIATLDHNFSVVINGRYITHSEHLAFTQGYSPFGNDDVNTGFRIVCPYSEGCTQYTHSNMRCFDNEWIAFFIGNSKHCLTTQFCCAVCNTQSSQRGERYTRTIRQSDIRALASHRFVYV